VTAIDRDQVLQKLETLHDSQAKSHDMALWRDGVWQAILEVRAIAALPAIPLDDELRDEIMQLVDFHLDPLLAANRDFRDDLSQVLFARGALPVLETKKEES
jgi:hypothetical protein